MISLLAEHSTSIASTSLQALLIILSTILAIIGFQKRKFEQTKYIEDSQLLTGLINKNTPLRSTSVIEKEESDAENERYKEIHPQDANSETGKENNSPKKIIDNSVACEETKVEDEIFKEVQHEENQIEPEEDNISTLKEAKDTVVVLGETFIWPVKAALVENATSSTKNISTELKSKLESMGIFRDSRNEENSESKIESAARESGKVLTRKQVRFTFDTFLAKSRPGLETESGEEKENVKGDETPKTKKAKSKGTKKTFVKFIKPMSESTLVRAF